jgi:DNA-binding transcriptional LysR family regulator
MDVNQLEVLIAVARERSFSRAAQVLDRTQPAVSQAIARLEAEVGESLFDRSSKDGTLTPAGEILLYYARQMLNLRSNAYSALTEMRSLNRGRVRISANEHTVFFLLPIIQRFLKKYPLIKIEVQRGVASRIPEQITAREVELGVVSFAPKDQSVKSVTVMKDELVLIASPGHCFGPRSEISIEELGEQVFVAHNAPSPYRHKVIEAFEKHKTHLNIAIELPSLEAIKKFVQKYSEVVALVPRLTAKDEIDDGRLHGITVKEIRLERKLNIIYRRNSVLSHASEAFLEMAKDFNRTT